MLESFPAEIGSVPGGALVDGTSNSRVGVSCSLLAQVSQYSTDDILVLNAGDDPDRTTAAATDLDVGTEHAF
ncbi:hypothetical protein BST95_02845 [Halioglobus japonicus]|nr:hypothetical protein BST95_02845 [Halioglobus japonicus]